MSHIYFICNIYSPPFHKKSLQASFNELKQERIKGKTTKTHPNKSINQKWQTAPTKGSKTNYPPNGLENSSMLPSCLTTDDNIVGTIWASLEKMLHKHNDAKGWNENDGWGGQPDTSVFTMQQQHSSRWMEAALLISQKSAWNDAVWWHSISHPGDFWEIKMVFTNWDDHPRNAFPFHPCSPLLKWPHHFYHLQMEQEKFMKEAGKPIYCWLLITKPQELRCL